MAIYGVYVGINDYPGKGSDLRGCVNDAKDWQGVFKPHVRTSALLLDNEATHKRIIQAFSDIIASLQRGDTAILTYSGHGTWIPDKDGDEEDGKDECLCPYDVAGTKLGQGPITDDALYRLFRRKVDGSSILFITDSCHSGTVVRMAGETMENCPRFMPPQKLQLTDRQLAVAARGESKPFRATAPQYAAGVVHLSGCRDHEYSYDAVINGRPNGAMTATAVMAYKAATAGMSYKKWHAAMRKSLPSYRYPQTPVLNGLDEDILKTVPGK